MTIDTGSDISIVREDVLSEEARKQIHPVQGWLRTATGEREPLCGESQLQVRIGSRELPETLWVAGIHDQCILGLDFLQSHNCQVNLKDGVLVVDGEETPLRRSATDQEPSCCRLVLSEGVCLPPLSESVVPVTVDGASEYQRWGLFEQTSKPQSFKDLLVARTLVDLKGSQIPLRVMNLSTQPQKINKGAELAHCETLSTNCTIKMDGDEDEIIGAVQNVYKEMKLPPHLMDLYDRSTRNLSRNESSEVFQLLCDYADIFSTDPSDLGCTDLVQHYISTGNAAPIRQPPRRLPLAKKEVAEKAIIEMQKQNVIEPSSSPWSSPIVLVNKKDGSMRFCVDYRRLNEVTHKDSYPLPRIDDTIDALAGSKWFSMLDLKSGYWQVQLSEEAKEKTAFSSGNGLWQFKVMPFGLCNAPATFERLMEQVLVGLPTSTALVYLDDILIPGRSFSQQISNLREVFGRLRNAKLKLSPKKCVLFRREVKYLGHMVSEQGISPDPGKVEAVKSWPRPTTPTEVKSFVGLCSYYRQFVPSFADVAQPLYQCAITPFQWTPEAEDAFQKLKVAMTEPPVLVYPEPHGLFILDADASNTGVGAVLSQQLPDNQEKVVAYYSRVLSASERRYCVTRRELLAVVKAVKHFHVYLYGRNFLLRTDHAALRWLLNFRQPEGQVARWIERLQQYDFTVEHRPGAKHQNADALSRRPCLQDACRHCDRLESLEQSSSSTDVLVANAPQVAAISLGHESRSPEDIRAEQLQDEDIQPVIKWMEENCEKPTWEVIAPHSQTTKVYCAQWQSLKLSNGVLYRMWETPSGDATILQLVLPKSLRHKVLQQLHNTKTSGHLGVAKTLGRIRERFYWVKCRQDEQDWCRTCDVCAQKRGPQKKIIAPLKTINVGSPMERIAIDVLGPLPTTEASNKYILIVADYFTKWVEAFPLPNQEAKTVADKLVNEVICRFGIPLIIHSDQGRNFESALFAELCLLLDIQKTRTTPYHPQSDGMVERFNRTLEMQLSKFADYNQKDWDVHIPMLLMAYRSAVHDTSGCTPAKLMLGRDLRLPIDLIYGRPEEEPAQTVTDYAISMQEKVEHVHNFAREHIRMMSDKMKQRHDLNVANEGHHLQQGDAVWFHNPQRKKGLTPKLQRPWQGPYIITKQINDLVYRIQLNPKSKPKVVHRNRLWRYTGANSPTWFQAQHNTLSTPVETTTATTESAAAECTEASNTSAGCELNELTKPDKLKETLPRRSSRNRHPPLFYQA